MIGLNHRADSVKVLREPLRMGLTVMVLGAAALSLQAWLSNRHVWRTAGFVAATALTKAAVVLVLVLVVAGLLVALRPKRTVQQALMVTALANILLGIVTGRPVLALTGAIGFALIVMARSLWWELSDTRATRLGRFILLAATGLVVALFLVERPKGTLIALFTLVLLIALGAGLWGLLLLVRNAPLPSSIGPLATVYEEYARAGISPFTLMHDKRYFWNQSGTAYLAYAARAGGRPSNALRRISGGESPPRMVRWLLPGPSGHGGRVWLGAWIPHRVGGDRGPRPPDPRGFGDGEAPPRGQPRAP